MTMNKRIFKEVNYNIIFACFARSFDDSHIKNKKIHLVSSVVNSTYGFNIGYTNFSFLREKIEKGMYRSTYYIFNVFCGGGMDICDSLRVEGDYFGCVRVINVSIFTLIKCIENNGKMLDLSENLITEIFGGIDSTKKDFDSILQDSVFLFYNIKWDSIVLFFKLRGIEISGGTISRRHILDTVSSTLKEFLDLIYDYNTNFINKKIIYNSFKNKDGILSSFVNFDYKKNIDYGIEVKNILIKDSIWSQFNNIVDIVKKIKEDKKNFNIQIFVVEDYLKSFQFLVNLWKRSICRKEIKENIIEVGENEKKLKLYDDKIKENIKIVEHSKASKDDIGVEMYEKEVSNYYDLKTNLEKQNTILRNEILKENNRLNDMIKDKNITELYSMVDNLINVEQNPKFRGTDNFKKKYPRRTKKQNLNFIKNRFNPRFYSTDNSMNKINFNINSPIYMELQRILNNSSLDENTQIKIENFLNNQGKLILKAKMDEISDINYFKLNPYLLEFIVKSKEELNKLIDNYRINIKNNDKEYSSVEILLISNLSNEDIISYLLGRVLKIISNNNLCNKNTNCTNLALDLVDSLLFHFYGIEYQNYINKSNISYKEYRLSSFINDNYSEMSNKIDDVVKLKLGLKLFYLLEEVKIIHTNIYIVSKDQTNLVYVANDVILDKIGKSFELLNLSYKIPMIVPPKPFGRNPHTGEDILGGYLLNDRKFIYSLIIKNPELKEQSYIKDDKSLFNTANRLSNVGFKINIEMLEFILEKGLDYELIIDPNFNHPLGIKKNNKNKLTLVESRELDAFLSKKQLEMNILGLALTFKNVPEFYIPIRLDNRGRIYCMVDYLNYQSIELAKSLLLFSKGDIVNKCDKFSINYLKIFGANCYGNGIDKKSFEDRVNWVDNNEDNILNFKNGKLIKEADSKLLFIAFCFEYKKYYNSLFSNDLTYTSYFPIQLDATCNGYQHLSLLTGDEPLAYQLNLTSGDFSSLPKDFYSYIGLKINDYLNKEIQNAEETIKLHYKYKDKDKDNKYYLNDVKYKQKIEVIGSCNRLIKLKINRIIVKLPIMVKIYNASIYQMVNYFKEHFYSVYSDEVLEYENEYLSYMVKSEETLDNTKEKKKREIFIAKSDNQVKLNNHDLYFFIKILEKVIYNEFPKLKEFSKYLEEIAKICNTLNLSIIWALPSGLIVNQYYEDSVAIRLKPFRFKKNSYKIKVKTKEIKINKNKQIRALMPNLIHSLDAASLSLIVDNLFLTSEEKSKHMNFFSIHDCFGVTTNNVVDLIKNIKLIYIKIYSEDSYLKRFDKGIIDNIKSHFGEKSFDHVTNTISVNGLKLKYPNINNVIKGKISSTEIMSSSNIVT